MQSRNPSNYKGIDVSNHNGNVDFAAVKNAGIQIVYMKATEGRTFKDQYLEQNYGNSKANGLLAGFYHFFHSDSDIDQQVDNFVQAIQGKVSDCKPAIDIEVTDNQDKDTISAKVLEFAQKVKEKTGLDCCLYTYTSFAKSNLNNSVSSLPLWIAHYGVDTPGDNGIWNDWVGFQYSESGSISGVNGRCDVNEFNDGILLGTETKQTVMASKPNVGGFRDMNITYKNGSTPEPCYADDDLTLKIGSLNPYEQATQIGVSNGKPIILYNTPNGKKVAFVKYNPNQTY